MFQFTFGFMRLAKKLTLDIVKERERGDELNLTFILTGECPIFLTQNSFINQRESDKKYRGSERGKCVYS